MTTPFVILTVDDNPNNLFTLRALLKRLHDCEIVEASSGEEALARVVEREVHLILLDVQMPGMDGYETAKHLKMTARTRDIPIIFLTAVFKSEEFIKRGYAVGAIDYLTKPLDDNQLLNRLSLYRVLHFREMALQDALEKLRRSSEARFMAYFEHSLVGMAMYSPAKGWLEVNDAFCAMMHYSRADLVKLTWADITHPDDIELDQSEYKRVLSGESKGYSLDMRFIRKEGQVVYTRMALSAVLDDQGGVDYLARMVEDITERKLAEQMLLQKTGDLQRSNFDLEQFAYSVSHDMRQPLRAVSGHLQLLQKDLKGKLDEDGAENLNFALDGAKRMDSMIVSLLEYSRIGRKTESKKLIASRDALDEALGYLESLIADSGAKVNIDGEWPQVFASRDELVRLFQNLVANAIKFREAGQAALVEATSAVHGDIWRVGVRDYGIGINPVQTDRLFHFFSRLQSRTRFEGTGMGLALCKRIVEHHDGRIWVESEGEGKGSTFIFEMPLNQPEGGAHEP